MRTDRKNNELREIKFTKNFTKNALGSVLVEFGDTRVITTASVEEGKPRWMDKDDSRGWLTAEYSLLPSSTNTRCQRERTKISGRTQEIQRLIGRSLRACVDLEKMPDLTITIDADVIQADGILKENPILEPVAAISAGIINGEVRLDLCYEEDSHAQVDSNIVLTKSGKIIEFQTTAEGEPYEYAQMVEIFNTAKNGIEKIVEMYDKV